MGRKRKEFVPQTEFSSIQQAAAALGIDKAIFQWAKAEGAPGFRHSRVHWTELEPWLIPRLKDVEGKVKDKRALECELLVEKIAQFRFDAEKDRGLWMRKAEFETWAVRKSEQLKKLLHDLLEVQMPPKLEGMRAAEVAAKMREIVVEVVDKFRSAPAKDDA